jgi:hypothetical protein
MKDDEYREWQALPAHVRLDAAGELSAMQFQWKENGKERGRDVQPGLHRTLVRVPLKSKTDLGMADVIEGRLTDFDAERIIASGRTLSAKRAACTRRKKHT